MIRKNYILIICLLLSVCCPVFARARVQYVAVGEIESKEKPSFWSKNSEVFYYGDSVNVVEEKGSWVKVQDTSSSKSGWIKEECITSKRIRADRKVSVDADEIALAGKGFSNALEAEYSGTYDIDFDIVDYIENSALISNEDLYDFIVDGKLKDGE